MNFVVIQMECTACGYQAKPYTFTILDDVTIRFSLRCDNCRHLHSFDILQEDKSVRDKIISALQLSGYEQTPF